MVGHLREQAEACAELGSPLYAHLLARVAGDAEAGGPAAAVLAGHEDDPGPSALGLRLMGGAHRLALERRAPALALCYPSVGGAVDPDAAWTALRDVLVEHRDQLRSWLDRAPQTNEIGRAAALVGALLQLPAGLPRPVRLVEIGASAGLNLRADRFRIETGDGAGVGPPDSPVVLRDVWRGPVPPLDRPVEVVERLGCDVAPVDPTTTEGRLRLTSYVWPDQAERLERLRGALDLARRVPATVERARAADFLSGLTLRSGTTTVVWHSVMWQYLDPAEQGRAESELARLAADAGVDRGFAHISLEPRRRAPDGPREFLVAMRSWPGAAVDRVLGSAHPHGIPTVWD